MASDFTSSPRLKRIYGSAGDGPPVGTTVTPGMAEPDVQRDTPGWPPCDARVEMFLPPERSAAGNARDFVKTTLRGWGLPGLTDDAAVITAELFGNALRHPPSHQYVLAVDWNGGRPRIEMWDAGDLLPRKQNLGIDAETGRGLHLVEALSASWGSRRAASGKCVWAVL